MKKFFSKDLVQALFIGLASLMLLWFCAIAQECRAQDVIRHENVFEYATTSHTRDTLKTNLFFKDNKGVKYTIIVNKKTGRCYIWKKSSKTGKYYKMYLKPELAKQICKELGITYVEK